MKKHILIGLSAAVVLLGVYATLMSLAEGPRIALLQASQLWYWIALLAVGFGTQAALFSFIKYSLQERQRAAAASIGASGGMSAGSMVACCAHHLTDVLPVVGLAGLATILAGYQTVFLLTGVLSNMVGITIMLETIQHHGLWQRLARINMRALKKIVMVSSGLVLAVFIVVSILANSLA
ncbi:MAG: hypothetical protein HYX81_04445 [Chloroflexi bacterium]|nr:hypothetical protein [Chloroflexota bacterium]